jgi:hypothetical protein
MAQTPEVETPPTLDVEKADGSLLNWKDSLYRHLEPYVPPPGDPLRTWDWIATIQAPRIVSRLTFISFFAASVSFIFGILLKTLDPYTVTGFFLPGNLDYLMPQFLTCSLCVALYSSLSLFSLQLFHRRQSNTVVAINVLIDITAVGYSFLLCIATINVFGNTCDMKGSPQKATKCLEMQGIFKRLVLGQVGSMFVVGVAHFFLIWLRLVSLYDHFVMGRSEAD